MSEQKKTPSARKVLTRVIVTVLVAAVLLVTIVFAVWRNEISSVMSFRQLRARDDSNMDGAVYQMDIKGGFYLDDFVAQGGAKNDSELISFITGKITKGLVNLGMTQPEIGCASFTATNAEGDKLFARNYDFSKTNTCIVTTEGIGDRHATISTADLQFLSLSPDKDVEGLMNLITCLAVPYIPLDGINDAGVSCGIYMTYQGDPVAPTDQNTDKPDITSTTLLRLILDYADDIDEAVEIAEKYDLHDSAKTSFHYMVADSSGRSAVLEWVGETNASDTDGKARKLVVTYNDSDAYIGEREGASSFQWLTNFIIQPGYYDDEKDMGGLDRYNRIYEELAPTNAVVADEKAAMDILGIVGRRSWNPNGKSCTVHSVVYNLTDLTAMWVPNEHYNDPSAIFTFSLK